MRGFNEICRERHYNKGQPLNITISQINNWLDLHMITGRDQRLFFKEMFMSLDDVWVEEYPAWAARQRRA